MNAPEEDAERGARHAQVAEEILEEASAAPEQLAIQLLTQAAAHAALATYYELRARP